jgi:radical SAM protein with 4Fe4S-binding SPASM domain
MTILPEDAVDLLRSYGVRPPKTLTFAVTGICNLVCSHCWVDAGLSTSDPHVPGSTVKKVIREFSALGGNGIRFTGGEPLCHPQWLEFMTAARSLGFSSIALQTNGMLLTDQEIDALCNLDFEGLSLQISLDGATGASHDLVRGRGAFDRVMDRLNRLAVSGLGPRVTLYFTEMRHNLEEVPAVLALAERVGAGGVVTGTLVACGRGGAGSAVSAPSPEQYLNLLHRYDTDQQFREIYEKLGRVASLEWHRDCAVRLECCTFIENPYLTARGRLYPCVLCHTNDYSVSSVFRKGLAASFGEGAHRWRDLLEISRSRADMLEQCRECPGSRSCAGGCMGRAWESSCNLMAADDRCGVRNTVYRG